METGKPDLELAKKFAEAVKADTPISSWPTTAARRSTGSSTWTMTPSPSSRTSSARWASPSSSSPWPASTPSTTRCSTWLYGYAREQMKAYVDLQEREFAAEERGYTATKHQREVGAGYFDKIATTVDPNTSTAALRARPKRASSTGTPEFADGRGRPANRRSTVRTTAGAVTVRRHRPALSTTQHPRAFFPGLESQDPALQNPQFEEPSRWQARRSRESVSSVPARWAQELPRCARASVDVLVYESTRELAAAGRARVMRSLDRGVSNGKLTEREREQAAWRLRFTSDLGDFADRQLVVEAVVEDEAVKTAIFAELDKVVTDPSAMLASNTSPSRS